MNIVKRPEALFLIGAIIFLLLAFFGPAQSIDLHLHDTYFVIGNPFLYLAPAILFGTFWLVDLLCRRIMLSELLTWIHAVLTISFVVLLLYYPVDNSVLPRRYLAVHPFRRYHPGVQLAVLGFALGQLAFIVNLAGGALRAILKR